MSETASAAVVEEKMEETHISALPDELPTTAPCSFHDNVNHFYDGHWSNLAIEPEDTPVEKCLVNWNKHALDSISADTDA